MNSEQSSRILLVEDDAGLAAMVRDFLVNEGFYVAIEGRGDDAIPRITSEAPDAVILDINLPGQDGLAVCRAVRDQYAGVILILTARAEDVDEIIGLEIGADDYLAKPVKPRVLLARLRAHLRKSPQVDNHPTNDHLTVGSIVIDCGRRTCELEGKAVDLTTAEFDLLWLLAENAGKVLSRAEISQTLLGLPYDGLDRSIDLRVSRLRKRINDDPTHPERIKSVRGVGYILAKDS